MKFIAEFCQNHGGDRSILDRLIDEAAASGSTYAKIQTIFAEDLSFRERFEEGEHDEKGNELCIKRPYQAEYDRLKPLELDWEDHRYFVERCEAAGLIPMTTAFNRRHLEKIKDCGFHAIKIASYDCGSIPLLRKAASIFQEVIISTGASTEDEVREAAACLGASSAEFSFLHCVTIYPTPVSEMHLSRMLWLSQFSPSVGLSDHSLTQKEGVSVDCAAVYLGADLIERHFTILKPEETRDGKVSVTPAQAAEIVDFGKLSRQEQFEVIREKNIDFGLVLGSASRKLGPIEMLNRDYYRGRFCDKIEDSVFFPWEEL